jgi:hypothetical protein
MKNISGATQSCSVTELAPIVLMGTFSPKSRGRVSDNNDDKTY